MLDNRFVNFSIFESLEDHRRRSANFRHDLIDVIVLSLCATICNCDTWEEIEDFGRERYHWLKKYITLENGIPTHDTIGRVMARMDPDAFFQCLREWVDVLRNDLRDKDLREKDLNGDGFTDNDSTDNDSTDNDFTDNDFKNESDLAGKGIQIDGKTARNSRDKNSNLKALHMVSAWVDDLGICLGQVAIDKKSNEITAVPVLLELFNIKGSVITMDAMNCQKKIVKQITDRKADYVISVKKNQPTLHELIAETFIAYQEDGCVDRKFRSHQKTTRSRGRITEQTVTVAPVPPIIKSLDEWSGIQSIVMVYRHREATNPDNPQRIKESDHVTYFISSLPPKAEMISQYIGQHWSVENSLHWSLDVNFKEDRSRIRKGNAPKIMAGLRRFALSLLKQDTSLKKTSLKRKRQRAAMNPNHLNAFLIG